MAQSHTHTPWHTHTHTPWHNHTHTPWHTHTRARARTHTHFMHTAWSTLKHLPADYSRSQIVSVDDTTSNSNSHRAAHSTDSFHSSPGACLIERLQILTPSEAMVMKSNRAKWYFCGQWNSYSGYQHSNHSPSLYPPPTPPPPPVPTLPPSA